MNEDWTHFKESDASGVREREKIKKKQGITEYKNCRTNSKEKGNAMDISYRTSEKALGRGA